MASISEQRQFILDQLRKRRQREAFIRSRVLFPTPTPEEEALQSPLVEPADLLVAGAQGFATAAPGVASKVAGTLLPPLSLTAGLMTQKTLEPHIGVIPSTLVGIVAPTLPLLALSRLIPSLPTSPIPPQRFFPRSEEEQTARNIIARELRALRKSQFRDLGAKPLPSLEPGRPPSDIALAPQLPREVIFTFKPGQSPRIDKTSLDDVVQRTLEDLSQQTKESFHEAAQRIHLKDLIRSPKSPLAQTTQQTEAALEALDTALRTGAPSAWTRFISTGRTIFQRLGESGKELADRMFRQRRTAAQNVGKTMQTILRPHAGNLTPEENNIIREALDKGNAVFRPELEEKVTILRKWLDSIADRAEELNLPRFQRRENFFPHMVKRADLLDVNKRQAFRDAIKAGNTELSDAAADRIIAKILERSPKRSGHLEFPREFNYPFYEKDVFKALSEYAIEVEGRLTRAEFFGPSDEIADQLIRRIGEQFGLQNERYARDVFNLFTGKSVFNSSVDQMINAFGTPLRTLVVAGKMGLAAISNVGQPALAIAKLGFKPFFQTMREVFKEGGLQGLKEFAELSGAITDASLQEIILASMGAETEIASSILRSTGMNSVELWDRMVAANMGKFAAQQLATKLLQSANPTTEKELLRQLSKIGLDGLQIIKQGGLITQDLYNVGFKAAADTQFLSDVLSLPLFVKSPLGRIVTHLQTFVFQYTKFLKDEIINEALVHGNFKPLARFAILVPTLGEAITSLKSKLSGKQRKEPLLSAMRQLENVASLGAMGTLSMYYEAAKLGTGPLALQLLGPGLSDIVKISEALVDSVDKNNFDKFIREVIPPLVGISGPLIAQKLQPGGVFRRLLFATPVAVPLIRQQLKPERPVLRRREPTVFEKLEELHPFIK